MTDPRDQLQAAPGTRSILERELGAGGMSRVYLAKETALRRPSEHQPIGPLIDKLI